MKNWPKRTAVIVTLCLVGLASLLPGAYAAATATAYSVAEVIAPIGISYISDMDFGLVAFGQGAGTVVVTAPWTRSVTGSAIAVGADPTAAGFLVTGEVGCAYSITLPNSITITDGTHSMTVDSFTSSPDGTGILSDGTDSLRVGATLHSLGNQPSGIYVGTFNVSVAYN